MNNNENYNYSDLRSSEKLKENLMGSDDQYIQNQILIENVDKSLEDDTFVENRNMKLNSKLFLLINLAEN